MEPLTPTRAFLTACADYGIALEDGDAERLGLYLALLLDANTRFNLTGIKEPEEAWTRHVFDSLTLLPFLSGLPAGARVADVGSGGGAPGLVLAAVSPALRFTLVEATGKKAVFLAETARALGLTNVDVVSERAETVGAYPGGALRGVFDAVVARALGRVAVAAELTVPLAKEGGLVLLVKGAQAQEEIEEAAGALIALRARVADIATAPTGRIVAFEKTASTPRAYPRRPGEPKRRPLGALERG